MLNNQFVNVRFAMHRVHLSLVVTAINFLLFHGLAPLRRERFYANPENINYLSSIHVPLFGCVAFRRMDGSIQYRW